MVYLNAPSDSPSSTDVKRSRTQLREETRSRLIRTGAVILCEQSYASMGIEAVLQRAGLSKGSFYHFFASKELFGLEVVKHYAEFFNRRLDRTLKPDGTPALSRLRRYTEDGMEGMARFDFTRGCLIGNLMQELAATHPAFRQAISEVLSGWENRIANCLEQAISEGDLLPSTNIRPFAEFFWTGWEGALMQAKRHQSVEPVAQFVQVFFMALPRADNRSLTHPNNEHR
ncbi:TetR family transcriptional regulator C-terminal domain-containing protein [Zwartia sp.]|uniref:TetR/AcrR family transcriptional regulator n=1 Tax=Zwartia sp. TaxID=2978004 RepID=UPI00271D9911|nr:TetR family transcriptional regulator C-terminal domain-containing protein [Zwartia sp.]MDO9023852.1 TetR family transcriptional regulator C-terminal domain-containing protein [Zwartia sp.]